MSSEGFGPWIRPVSNRENEEISNKERLYEDKTIPELLDVIEIRFIEARPTDFQIENHLIDSTFTWRKVEHVGWTEAESAIDSTIALWINGSSSSSGLNDRVPAHSAKSLAGSLFLIRPESLTIEVAGGKRKAHFEFEGVKYVVSITDPWVKSSYTIEGSHRVPEAILCVSLGGVFNGYAYKLVAAVITPGRSGE